MKIKNFLFLCAIVFGGIIGSFANDNQLEPSSSSSRSSPLSIEEFSHTLVSLYPNDDIPISHEYGESAQVYLKLKSITNLKNGQRCINLRILNPLKTTPIIPPIKRRKLNETEQTNPGVPIGKMVLIENPAKLNDMGHFQLDFLYVYDEYQGQGIGSKALGALKTLTAHLYQKSSFYKTISLLSQDVEYNGKPLTLIPTRVKFYMNNGFVFDQKTIELIKFLDIKYFINQFDTGQFAKYIKYYILPRKMHLLAPKISNAILPLLQSSDKFSHIPFDDLVTYVRVNGGLCSIHILDRAYYWAGIADKIQAKFGSYTYLMHHTLESSEPPSIVQQLSPTAPSAETFLCEKIMWKNKELLPDQNRMNAEIFDLMMSPSSYSDSNDQGFSEHLRQLW